MAVEQVHADPVPAYRLGVQECLAPFVIQPCCAVDGEALAGRGLSSLVVEGGRRAAAAFLAQGLVDRIMLFTSDVVVGDRGIASPAAPDAIPDGFTLRSSARFGADRLLEYMKA